MFIRLKDVYVELIFCFKIRKIFVYYLQHRKFVLKVSAQMRNGTRVGTGKWRYGGFEYKMSVDP